MMEPEESKGREIDRVVRTAMESLREMLDVNTIVGQVIECEDGGAVIPVSRVSCGFVAGGGEYAAKRERPPFLGGSGAGLSVQPVGFLVINGSQVRLIPIAGATPLDKALEAVPLLADRLEKLACKRRDED